MRVNELMDLLQDFPSDAEVELAIVQPVGDDDDDVVVLHYDFSIVFPQEVDGELFLWLIGGEDDDVEQFLDALDETGDD